MSARSHLHQANQAKTEAAPTEAGAEITTHQNGDTPTVMHGAIRYHLEWVFSNADPGEFVNVCAEGDWPGLTVSAGRLDLAADYLVANAVDRNVYVRMTTLIEPPAPGQRGEAERTASVPVLWLDVDVAGPNHKRPVDVAPLPDRQLATLLMSRLPTPSAYVMSGGGYYPLWRFIEPLDPAEGKAMADHLHAVATRLWAEYHLDNTGELARVLRPAGVLNHKSTPPVPTVATYDGPDWEAGVLRGALDALAATLPPVPVSTASASVSARPKVAYDSPMAEGVITRFASAFTLADVLAIEDAFAPWTLVGHDHGGRELWRRFGTMHDHSVTFDPSTGVLFVWSSTVAAHYRLPSGVGVPLLGFVAAMHGVTLSEMSRVLTALGGRR